MNISEQLEKHGIEKEQLIIFGVIGIVVIFLLYGLLGSSSEEKDNTVQDINMPENKSKKDYKTKLDAYAKENQERENNISLDFDRDLLDDDVDKTKKEILEEKIDSMMASKAPKQNNQPRSTRRNYSNHTRNSQSNRSVERQKREQNQQDLEKEREKEKIKERNRLNAFFKNSNKTVTTKNDKDTSKELRTDKNIKIMVNGDQNIKDGSRINLLLLEKAVINGISYNKNTKLYGFAKFGNHRLFININSINNEQIKLKVYDAQDGNLGLYTKQNLLGEVSEDVADDVVDDVNIKGVEVGKTIKKIFKKKNKEKKILLFNRTKFFINK